MTCEKWLIKFDALLMRGAPQLFPRFHGDVQELLPEMRTNQAINRQTNTRIKCHHQARKIGQEDKPRWGGETHDGGFQRILEPVGHEKDLKNVQDSPGKAREPENADYNNQDVGLVKFYPENRKFEIVISSI